MKLLHVIFINGFGGAEKLLLQLLPALNDKIEVHCLIVKQPTNDQAAISIGKELEQKNIPVYFLNYKLSSTLSLLKKISQIIRGGNYDTVHSHLKYADLWLALLKKAKRINIPVVSTMHGYNDTYENKFGFSIDKSLRRSIYYRISKWIFGQLDGFILISKIVSQFLNDSKLISGKHQTIIYHGYLTGQTVTPSASPVSYSLAIPGRLLVRKGHIYVLNALKILLKDFSEASVHIYGDGPEAGSLKEFVKQNKLEHNVVFHGYVPDLVNRLQQMQVVVIPSLWEGFGLVFLDAFAAGVPVVAFDLPAANEILTHGVNGLLVTPRSVEDLSDKIKTIFTDMDLSNKLVNNGRKDLLERFTMSRMRDEYLRFYQKINE